MSGKINWGVLGAAAIALQRTMPALKEAPSAALVALASRDMNKGRATADSLAISRVYGSYGDLLADPEIDAVYIPLPNRLHFEWSVNALEAGKNVLCEKPLCMSADEVRKLCTVRDKSRRHIEEGFVYRNHPQWAKVDELLSAGAIGEVRSVHATLAKRFLDPADIRNDFEAGGGALYDLGSYTVSACNLVFKRAPIRVVAAIDRDPGFRIDRLSSVLLDYGDQHAAITVSTQGGTSAWGSHQQMSVLGEKGWMRFQFPFAHARPTACRLELGDETSVGAFPTHVFEFEAANQYLLEVERFSRFLLGESVPTWPIEDSLDILRTIEAIFESARTGQWQLLE
jgi:predicted dehydrogenase